MKGILLEPKKNNNNMRKIILKKLALKCENQHTLRINGKGIV